jgi:N-acetylglucosaminyldiphosphoundecaprenol N-acetyl-beta-D-mannosaminyltransferase
MIDHGKKNILGVLVDGIDFEAGIHRVMKAAHDHTPYSVSALAVHGLMLGVLNKEQRHRLNQFDLLTPDGQPVRWALNWLYRLGLRRTVDGPTLMLRVCQQAAEEGVPIFFFGNTDDTLALLRTKLLEQFPKLKIAGMRASAFRQLNEGERDQLVQDIRETGAGITFCGLGCPRQEVWAFECRDALSMPVISVGAAYSFHAGIVPWAPRAIKDWGFEWLFRLVHDPRRLWRRYLLLGPAYLTLLASQMLHLRKFDPANTVVPSKEFLYG